jgi:hypothetical protein
MMGEKVYFIRIKKISQFIAEKNASLNTREQRRQFNGHARHGPQGIKNPPEAGRSGQRGEGRLGGNKRERGAQAKIAASGGGMGENRK